MDLRAHPTPTIWQKCGACGQSYADWCICQTHGLCPMCHPENNDDQEANEAPNERLSPPTDE